MKSSAFCSVPSIEFSDTVIQALVIAASSSGVKPAPRCIFFLSRVFVGVLSDGRPEQEGENDADGGMDSAMVLNRCLQSEEVASETFQVVITATLYIKAGAQMAQWSSKVHGVCLLLGFCREIYSFRPMGSSH